jgi:hypothetical protein
MERVWVCWVGVQNVLEDDELNVGFWNVWLIQVFAGFRPKGEMVPPKNINQIVVEALQLPLIKAFVGNLSFGLHGHGTKMLNSLINPLSTNNIVLTG